MLATVGNEYHNFFESLWAHEDYRIPPASIPFLIMGSLVGTGIGYSGWWCRTVVSATSFTLIGGKCRVYAYMMIDSSLQRTNYGLYISIIYSD
jgi:hypothetical protein